MITPAQCRAARALLNWSQPELARRCDMHVQTISNFEQENGSPTKNTLQMIANVLEQAGIEFTKGEGVRFANADVTRYEGQDGFIAFMSDVTETVKRGNADVCISNVKESDWENNLPKDFAENYRAEMRMVKGFKSRIMVRESDDFHTAKDFAEYRFVSDSVFSDDACFYAYGSKLALITFHDEGIQIVVLNNKKFADSYRTMFNAIWKNHKTIK